MKFIKPQATPQPQVQEPASCASLNQADAARYIGISVTSLQRLEQAGLAPPRLRLGSRSARYLVASLDRWLAARVRETPAKEAKRRVAAA